MNKALEIDPSDPIRRQLLDEMLQGAAFDGWTLSALTQAGKSAGLTEPVEGQMRRLFPRGITDLLDFWASEEDRAMREAFASDQNKPQRIRDQITWLVRRRIEQLTPHKEAVRRASAALALPIHGGQAAKLAWRTAGEMWKVLGDRSLDGNFYSKRATLMAVYGSTLTRWLADDDEVGTEGQPFAKTWVFLDRRIDNVMQFEKLKAQVNRRLPKGADWVQSLAKMRYGTRQADTNARKGD